MQPAELPDIHRQAIDIRTPADAERPAQEEAATEIDEIIVTGQRDYRYRADQSDALGTSIYRRRMI